MFVEVKAEVSRVYLRTTKGGHTVADFSLKIPTTIIVDKETGEARRDCIDAFIFGDRGEKWDGFVGEVSIKGDLRVNRYLGVDKKWVVKPEIAISSINKISEYRNAK